MTLTDILRQEAEHTYAVTENLFKLVEPSELNWKPETGSNWMTVGQVLMHCTNACGTGIKGFVTGDWGVALSYVAEAGEESLLGKKSAAPWGGPEVTLFQHLYHMIGHLGQHKGQLFYYLKLLGKDVNTSHLWGM